MAFAYLCAWSWILSGWIRHELVPDDMSHPLPAGAHFRALCWHQFCVGLICGLISLIVFLPAWVLMITYGLADTYGPEYPISDVSFFIAFIILTFIAIFIIELFYLRYSVGIMSLTLYGQKMSLGEASAYRSEHEPIGLTRHFAFYTACYLVAIGAIGELIRTAVESAIPSIQIIDYLSMLTIMPVHLVAVIGVVALITGYLKNMPPHH
ncbi:YfhO family protein [Candidatus Puniceispirillum marinum]|nr:YfhO family protein [Candidatus Puniceispirillum marinum]